VNKSDGVDRKILGGGRWTRFLFINGFKGNPRPVWEGGGKHELKAVEY